MAHKKVFWQNISIMATKSVIDQSNKIVGAGTFEGLILALFA